MPNEQLLEILGYTILALSLMLLGVMTFTGALREKTLALGPTRDLGLPRAGYHIGAGLVVAYVVINLSFGGAGEEHPAHDAAQLLLLLLPFGLIGLLIGRAMHAEAGFRKIGLAPRWPKRDLLWALGVTAGGYLLASSSGIIMSVVSDALNLPINEVAHESLKRLQDDYSPEFLFQLFVGAVLIVPIMEELMFRGVLQTSLMHLFGKRRWPAVVLAAALFSVTHWWVVDWQGLAPLFVLGLVWGYAYERTGSLLVPVLAHAGFNAINIAIAVAQIKL